MNGTLKSGLFALAGAVLAAQTATAATTTYSDGDLLLGIRLADHSGLNYEVNLGNYSLFNAMNGSSFALPGVSIADLVGQYGAAWNQSANLTWGIGGYDNTTDDNLFLTRRRSDPLVLSTPFNNISYGNALNGIAQLSSMGAAFAGNTATPNSPNAIFLDAANVDSYNKRVGPSLNFGAVSSSIENSLDMTGGPVVSDLYKVLAGSSGQALYLGYFSFSGNGVTFTSVPEPGTAGLLCGGLLILLLRQRPFRKQA